MIEDNYNIAFDCVESKAQDPQYKDKTALLFVRALEDKNYEVLDYSFSEIDELVSRFAHALIDLNAQVGERLIIRLHNGLEFMVAFLGAIKAGLIPIPTSPLLTPVELDAICEDSGAAFLVSSNEFFTEEFFEQKLGNLEHLILTSATDEVNLLGIHKWDHLLNKAACHYKTEPTSPDDPAFWLYTSGTAGRPKAVVHAHRSIPAHDDRVKLWQDLKPDDIVFNTSALNWSYALTCGFLDLWRHGVTTVIYNGGLYPDVLCELVNSLKVSVFMSVPGVYRRCVQHLAAQQTPCFESVRVCLSAGEKLAEEIEERFLELTDKQIYEGLGMTEHSVYLVQKFGEPKVKGSCGQPLAVVKLLDDNLNEVKVGELGMLATHRSAPGLFLDYHQRPEESQQFLKGDWFLSGDMAYQNEDGHIFFMGRCDDVLTSGGYRVSPFEVEAVLNDHEAVSLSAVISEEVAAGKTLVVAYVILSVPPSAGIEQTLIDYAQKSLAVYKVPKKIYITPSLPQTPNGKIKRSDLKKSNQ